jgi:hypothetical protein
MQLFPSLFPTSQMIQAFLCLLKSYLTWDRELFNNWIWDHIIMLTQSRLIKDHFSVSSVSWIKSLSNLFHTGPMILTLLHILKICLTRGRELFRWWKWDYIIMPTYSRLIKDHLSVSKYYSDAECSYFQPLSSPTQWSNLLELPDMVLFSRHTHRHIPNWK